MRTPGAAAESAAAARATASGKAVVVGALTTATSLVWAEPDGTMAGSSSVLPVRVLTRAGWVPVDTSLHRAGGRLVPVAVPGDAVSFSAGGTGPAVAISAGHAGVRLWWPRALPAPSVSGSSAVYRNVLPGVNLVLTATSQQTGGFTDVLEVTSRAAVGDPGLGRLVWRVSAPGTSGLRVVAGGGLAARVAGWGPWFEASRPVMWDSSSLRPGASKAAVRGAAESALAAGAGLTSNDLGPVSSVAGPGGGARLAAVAARVGGQMLSLTPDMKLLSSPETRFPAFIAAAGVTLHDGTIGEQAYDPVQSDNGNQGCGSDTGACDTGVSCTGPHFDSGSYKFSPVGYDNFGAPGQNCQVNDTDRALYRVGIPSGSLASNAVIINASFQISEVYSSDCTSTAMMTATMINSINQGTAWPGPDAAAGNTDATKPLGPDPNSCNSVEDTSQMVSAGLNVTADLNAISNSATNMTFRVWEAGSPGDALHKQLTDNPTLEVQWVVKPGLPSSLEEAATSDGGTDPVDCSTSSANPPRFGKTDSVDGLYLIARYAGDGGASVQADIEYKVASASTWTLVKPANSSVASGLRYGFPLPASVTSKLADGTVMEWAAQAETGQVTIGTTTFGPYASGFTKPCFFAVYPHSPNPPKLAPVGFSETTPVPVGTSVKFTITESAGDTAAKFVWGLDSNPPTSSPPAAQVCSATATAACTALAKNSAGLLAATLTVPVYAPGPHDVTVYEVDTGGNDSGTTDGAPQGQTTTFSAAGDPNDQYTGGSSLEANFTDAVSAGKAYDNVMISTQAGAPGKANADGGSGDAIDELQMTQAGWDSGKTVTVDGATFQLPSFGTTADIADNLLSADQTIGTGPGGAQGSALVFLATSTSGNAEVPGIVGTGSGDAGALAPETTAPMVQAGYDVTGQDCSSEVSLNNTTPCQAATGDISYASGCSSGAQVPYWLSVPNWVTGPPDLAVLEMPDRDHPAGQQADNPKIYAFAVPVNPSCTVTSVTLPDVGPSAFAPALHILGMVMRNTTTATPQVGGGVQASPAGQAWTGAFESGIDNADGPPSGQTWGNQTVRIAVSPGVGTPAGSQLRIRLTDPGYYSEDGSGPIRIGAASIAQQQSGPAAQSTPIGLTFGDGASASAVIPEGGDIYSDPTQPLPFAITPGQDLLVSLYLQTPSLPLLPLNDQPSGSMSWFAPSSPTANLTGTQAGTAFTITGSTFASAIVPLLTGVDVTTPAVTGPNGTPGEPTVVVTGDGDLIDNNIGTIPPDAPNSPSQRLAGQLVSQGDATGYGVVDGSVASNAIFEDGLTGSLGIPPGGIEFQARVDHDILAEPDVGTVIVDMGLEEVLFQDGAEPLVMPSIVNTLGSVQKQLFAFGAGGIVFGQLTPCSGYSAGFACNSAADAGRQVVNAGLSDMGGICTADFAAAVAQPGSSPQVLNTAYDAGDHANLTLGPNGGYAALASMENINCGISPPGWVFPDT